MRRPINPVRFWLVLLGPLALSLGLAVLPAGFKGGLAAVLERSVFLPFRFAVGWGPRSLEAQHAAAGQIRDWARKRWESDDLVEGSAENSRLRRLLGFRRRGGIELIPATVVGRGRQRFGDLLVAEPTDPGRISAGLPVITPEGLVGRVQSRVGRFVRIECIDHRNVAVSIINQRSREGGILKWNPERGGLVVEGIPAQADWQQGDRLVTSGLGLDYPRGILVGWVAGRRAHRGGLLQTIVVKAAARASRAEEAFVLLPPEAPPPSLLAAHGDTDAEEDPVSDVSALFPAEPSRGRRLFAAAGPGPAPVP